MSDCQSCSSSSCGEGGTCPGQAKAAPDRRDVRRFVAVGSGKGGVGKSTTTALLAIAMARRGLRVGILDADVTGPSIPKLLGVRDPLVNTTGGMIPPASPKLDIRVMSVNLLLDDPSKPVVWRGPLIANLLKQFWDEVEWGPLDYLFIDLPPGTADAPLTVMQSLPLDGMVLVTSPQGLAELIVEKACHMARMLEVPLLGVVENMSFVRCPGCGQELDLFGPSHVEKLTKRFSMPLLGRFPVDPPLALLGDAGRLEEYGEAERLEALAQALEEALAQSSVKEGCKA